MGCQHQLYRAGKPAYRMCDLTPSTKTLDLKTNLFDNATYGGKTLQQYAMDYSKQEWILESGTKDTERYFPMLKSYYSMLSIFASIMKLPQTGAEFVTLMDTTNVYRDIVNIFGLRAVGNENLYDYSGVLADTQADAKKLFMALCNNTAYIYDGLNVMIKALSKDKTGTEYDMDKIMYTLFEKGLNNEISDNPGVVVDDFTQSILLRDIVTAINGVLERRNTTDAAAYYDLMGRRITAPQKGQIVITDGKKIIF